VLRELVVKMIAAELSPKTIVNYSQVVKFVVASAVTEDGEQVYPRKWNHDFIGLPIVEREKQHRPTVTEAGLGEILARVKGRTQMLFALLAGTGLRIGEARAIRVGVPPSEDYSYITDDCRMVYINKSIWGGQEQTPKTPAAIRTVDIPETLAQVLRSYAVGRNGYLFATAKGRPLQSRNVLRSLHATGKKIGLHAFRRFRLTWLRKNGVPKDLERIWMGHAPEEIGDIYSKLKEDEVYRREWCERAGIGFSVVTLLHKDAVAAEPAEVA